MRKINTYIIEKLRINKGTKMPDLPFYELSDDELISKMKDIIEKYNKENNQNYKPNIYYDKSKNEWRAQLLVNVAHTAKNCPLLFYRIVYWYGDNELAKKIKKYKYDEDNDKWIIEDDLYEKLHINKDVKMPSEELKLVHKFNEETHTKIYSNEPNHKGDGIVKLIYQDKHFYVRNNNDIDEIKNLKYFEISSIFLHTLLKYNLGDLFIIHGFKRSHHLVHHYFFFGSDGMIFNTKKEAQKIINNLNCNHELGITRFVPITIKQASIIPYDVDNMLHAIYFY